jgi:NAD(P)-dependent dehydrogenase (short-subunit alcohol dehydrogenase family)
VSAELRFDGRVAIVTGAGGSPGLGRAYARLLAERGAKVVVNDLGVGPDGRGVQLAHADLVAREIVEAGGEALADTNSVAGRDSARAVVETALDAWGRVDILVNNAGVCPLALFEEVSDDDIEAVVGVHLMGAIWMCRAVWPHLKTQGYGRIVNISSGAMYGQRYVPIYGAAKAGVFGLTRALAVEGAPHGICINTVSPAAGTVAITHMNEDSPFLRGLMALRPEQVAPLVAFLAHETCSLTGKAFNASGGHVEEDFASNTRGYDNPDLTLEDVRDNLQVVLDRTDAEPVPEEGPTREVITPLPYRPAPNPS